LYAPWRSFDIVQKDNFDGQNLEIKSGVQRPQCRDRAEIATGGDKKMLAIPQSLSPYQRMCTGSGRFSENLLNDAHLRHLEPHEHAFYEGDAQTHIYRIKSGMMRLYRLLADGRRQVIAFRLPGHLIGLGDQETQFCSAESLTSVVLQCVPLSIVYRRIQEEPRFGSELVRCLAVELAETRNQVVFLNRRSALEKLATFILGFLTWSGEDTRLELELHMGREDIADYLGLTVETVSRSFAKLKAQGVVSLPRTQMIIIHDIGRLIALAAGAIRDDEPDT
jgi:CRP/FNR family transcriptional regulator, anaerobic regulatory protein